LRLWMVHGAEPLLVRVRRSVKRRRPVAVELVPTPLVASDGAGGPAGEWGDVVDVLPEVMVVVDDSGRVVQANAAAQRVLGVYELPAEPSFLEFVDPNDRPKAAAAWRIPFTRRLGWQVTLDTPAARALFSFDCIPLTFRDGRDGLAMIGRQLTGRLGAVRR